MTATDGGSGTSQGYKITSCTPAQEGGAWKLHVPQRTLSAHVSTATAQSTDIDISTLAAFWTYGANIMTVQMKRNGHDITSPNNPEVPVMVGERNDMSVSLAPVPQDVTVTYQWSHPGSVVKDYTETADKPEDKTTNPVTPAVPNTAKITPLPASDLQTFNPYWYWYDATFEGNATEISVVVTLDNKPITIIGKLKIYRPRMDSFTGAYEKVEDPLVSYGPTGWIRFATFSAGITFSATASVPNNALLPNGNLGFEQIVTSNRSFKVDDNGTTAYRRVIGTNVLDSEDSDARYHLEGTGTGSLNPQDIPAGATNASATIQTSDQPGHHPGIQAGRTDKGLDFDEKFDMYLMYNPSTPNSIWVPLGKVHWEWGVKAHQVTGNTWTVTNYTPEVVVNPNGTHTRPVDPSPGTEWHQILQWNARYLNLPELTYTPNQAW